MPVTLSITSFQAHSMGEEAHARFGPEGGSFGRAAGNDWVLPDPMRYISSKHGAIRYHDDAYWLSDTSTNGIFINNSPSPLGRGNEIRLNTGDQIAFGDYVLSVSVESEAAAEPLPDLDFPPAIPAPPPVPRSGLLDDISLGNADGGDDLLDPLDLMTPSAPTSGQGEREKRDDVDMDPLALLGGDSSITEDDVVDFDDDAQQWGAASDHSSADQGFFEAPAATPEAGSHIIPDDWDLGDDDFGSDEPAAPSTPKPAIPRPAAPASPAQQNTAPKESASVDPLAHLGAAPSSPPGRVPASANPAPENKVTPAPPAPAATPAAARPEPPETETSTPPSRKEQTSIESDSNLFAAFLRGMGVEGSRIEESDLEAKMEELGGLFRLMVGGMMDVLQARASLKSEFRMDMTMIRAAENNPLKFSPTPDDAIFNLFFRKSASYLSPTASLTEGFSDLRHHQLAMVAAMQEAFQGMLLKLEPGRFEKQDASGTLKALNRKSRLWDSYKEFFDRLDADPDARFQQLFGAEFASAYESQISRLDSLED